jgi:hypothetical protein
MCLMYFCLLVICMRQLNCVHILIYIQGDQKVSLHLKITVHHQVHRDFLITLYIYLFSFYDALCC